MPGAEAMHGTGWDALEARAAAAGLPPYRRVWFLSLIRQGRAAEASGRAALAAHCRARLESEFAAFLVPAGSAARAGTASPPAPPPVVPPLAALAARRDAASRARVLELLTRHAARLPPAENAAFHALLEGAAPEAPAATIPDLRRRLVDRLMRAARYRRQAARLAEWKPVSPDAVPAGPYNDFRALEELLHRVASGHPHGAEWAAEFFDVYAGMDAVRRMYGELLPGK